VCEGSTYTCTRPLFRCDLETRGDLNILKMYLHTEDEAARLRHSKLLTVTEICMAKKIRIWLSRSKVKVKCHQLSNTFSVHHGAYSYSYINFWSVVFEILCGQTHRQTHKPPKTIPVCSMRESKMQNKSNAFMCLYVVLIKKILLITGMGFLQSSIDYVERIKQKWLLDRSLA